MTEAKRCGNECAGYRADIRLKYFKGLEHVSRTFKHIGEIQAYRIAFNEQIPKGLRN